MNFLDDLSQALAQSDKLDAATKKQIQDFLTQHHDLFQQLGQAAAQEFLQALTSAGPQQAYDALLTHLSEPQLLDLLRQVGPELTAALDRRTQILTHYRNFVQTLGDAALQILTHLLLAAL